MKMFIQFILLLLLLLPFSYISASRYGAYCTSDSDCDQHQKCLSQACRCNIDERRFWTGEICAVCVTGFVVTIDRCYKSFNELKTWADARAYCRTQYADLFTWRNNNDEQFIRPVTQIWASSPFFAQISPMLSIIKPTHPYLAWAGAIITSYSPYTTQWMDPDGLKLDIYSSEWCDPTTDVGYVLPREPTCQRRETENGTEREECVTYNFGNAGTSLLCLADDFCSQKYPYICEMNAASMKLANSALHGDDGENIDFEQPPPPPPPSPGDSGNNNSSLYSGVNDPSVGYGQGPGNTIPLSALSGKSGGLSMSNIVIFLGVGIILIVGTIIGYKLIKKKKETIEDSVSKNEDVFPNRPSFTSSVGSMMDE